MSSGGTSRPLLRLALLVGLGLGAVSVDKFVRGSNGYTAEDRVKLMKLLWDAIGSEFGGRHELYERNYFGNNESIRFETLLVADVSGASTRYKGFAEQCMAEYSLDGWISQDLIDSSDVSAIRGGRRFA